ncbi:MAG: glycosyltransferase family 4 protein [Rhizobiaceae bacterium]
MTTGLRIVHCFRSPVGGIFRHVRDLASAQKKNGHAIGIVCDSATGGTFEDNMFQAQEPELALGVTRIPMQRHIGPGDIAAAWRTFRVIRRLKPDIIHGHGAKGGAYARVFGSLLRVSGSRVARLYSPHGGSLHYDENTLTGKAIFAIERAMERQADHLLFVSEFERQTYRRKVGEPRVPNQVIYNGLRDAEFEPVRPDPDAADFLFIGMMRDLKGPDIFIDALSLASRQSGHDLSGVMVGDGDDLPKYKAQAKRLGISQKITFRPPMAAREAFALAKTIVVPSRAEAMPYIVLEALGAGMPMIATDVGGIPEIFDKKRENLCQPEAAAIAEAMVTAHTNPKGFRGRMPALAELKSRFSVTTMAAAIEQAYREATG